MTIKRSVRAVVAAGAVGTALLTSSLLGGTADAGSIICDDFGANAKIIDPCEPSTTIIIRTTTTMGRPTTTVGQTTVPQETTTTTEGEQPTTTARPTTTRPSTTLAPTTTAPAVGNANAARPVAAQAAYTG
ncbi:MAG: hypothetical protein KDB09_11720 [Acidimicrobiales bacterium]|nr:hypothetical protein [Acidimicrobiales bacterium]